MFRGNLESTVDAAGRLKLPALVRQSLWDAYGDKRYFITSLDGEHVQAFPIREWEVVEKRLGERSTEGRAEEGESKQKILFNANYYGKEEDLDTRGRLLIPARLRETAGMAGRVVLYWGGNKILVISGVRFEKEVEKNRLTLEDRRKAANLGL